MLNPRAASAVRRYARALLDVAPSTSGGAAAIHERLAALAAVLTQHAEARAFLAHPGVAREKKETLVRSVLADVGGGDEPVTRLVWLLIDRQRLALLPAIDESFVAAWNLQRGVAQATVTSAEPLDETQSEALRSALATATRLSVELTVRVDAALVGGLMVNIGGRTLDGTVRGRLRMLRERLHQAAVAR
jgi:F-type H+-transporting ATPase subunit delta